MVEKNMKEEEESTLEERRAREQLGEGVEVRVLFRLLRKLDMLGKLRLSLHHLSLNPTIQLLSDTFNTHDMFRWVRHTW